MIINKLLINFENMLDNISNVIYDEYVSEIDRRDNMKWMVVVGFYYGGYRKVIANGKEEGVEMAKSVYKQ